MNLRRWLAPGIGIKRWLLVIFAGLLLLSLAFAHVLRQVSRDLAPGGATGAAIDLLSLQFLPLALRGLVVGSVGLALVAAGAYRTVRALIGPFQKVDGDQPLVELIYQKRFLARGPRIVAIGGGTGLSILLRGLKEHTSNLTAIVTVAAVAITGLKFRAVRRYTRLPTRSAFHACTNAKSPRSGISRTCGLPSITRVSLPSATTVP